MKTLGLQTVIFIYRKQGTEYARREEHRTVYEDGDGNYVINWHSAYRQVTPVGDGRFELVIDNYSLRADTGFLGAS